MSEWMKADTFYSARIIKIGALSRDSLDINFNNGSILILRIDLILSLPGFEVLSEDDRIYYPKTDGRSVYWRDGPRSLTVEEILSLAGRSGSSGTHNTK